MNLKNILLLLLTIFVLSCSINQNAPFWYLYPKENDLKNLYGVGVGKNQEEASLSALKNLASKLSVTISSEMILINEQKGMKFYENSKETIKEVIQKISFNNYRITNSSSYLGKIYSEIAVDRNLFLKSKKLEFTDLNKKTEELHKRFLNEKESFRKREIVFRINHMATELAVINELLRSLNYISDKEFAENYKRYDFYRVSCDKFLNKAELFIRFKNTPEVIEEIILTALGKEKNMKISKSEKSDYYQTKISFDSRVTGSSVYGLNSVFIYIKIGMISSDNSTMSNNIVEIEGESEKNKEDAIKKSSKQLAELIEKNGVLKVLGIFW